MESLTKMVAYETQSVLMTSDGKEKEMCFPRVVNWEQEIA